MASRDVAAARDDPAIGKTDPVFDLEDARQEFHPLADCAEDRKSTARLMVDPPRPRATPRRLSVSITDRPIALSAIALMTPPCKNPLPLQCAGRTRNAS